jgi:hypothetical protein
MSGRVTTEEARIPEPSLNRINYDRPEDYLILNASLGREDRIREVASTLPAVDAEQTLVAIGRWIQAHLRYDPDAVAGGRSFDTAVDTGSLASCADHAVVFAALARARGIPAVFVKTMDVEWIREFRSTGTCVRWSGHVFLEVFLGGRWRLLDAQALILYDDYDPATRLFPGGRYPYDKGADPAEMVLSFEGERWLRQTRAYFSRFDLSLLPVGEGRTLDGVFVAANSPIYQAIIQRLQELGRAECVCSFNTRFDEHLPRSRGQHLILTCVGDTLVLPESYHARFLPVPVHEIERRMKSEPGGVLRKQLEDGTSVTLIYGRDQVAVLEVIESFQLASG